MAKRTRTPRRSRFALRWLAVGAILLLGLLYARPLRSYLSTKHDLAKRAADVRTLKSERRALQHRLAESTERRGPDRAGAEARARAPGRAALHRQGRLRAGCHDTLRSSAVDDDRAIVERQIGRPPRAFRRVAVRCPFGRPAVTEQAPFDDSGEPFPTTFYVTCRHLVAALARLEAAGGVERWSRLARGGSGARASAERGHAEQRRLRPELAGGIGGQTRTGGLKCLHAHAAFALAQPGYELGERILAEVDPLWPDATAAPQPA